MTQGCYTCRRRRIICDNGLPTCRKCRNAGKECLGYKKPLVWVKGGVASRGRMMGRSFEDVNESAGPESGSSTSTNSGENNSTGSGPADAVWQDESDFAGGSGLLAARSTLEAVGPENSLVDVANFAPKAEFVPSPWGLVDPLLKDHSDLSRFYIYHFNQHLVNYLVLYPNIKNPYRDLLALVGDSPVLAHAISATGALHYAILYHDDSSPAPWSSAATMPLEELENAVTSSVTRRPAAGVYEDFLAFKQRALRQLYLDIGDPTRQNDDRTVAAIIVLALLDAIESGGGSWKYHLEGAKKLLQSRESDTSASAREIIGGLDTFAVDGCLIMQLMGSTLSRPGTFSKPFYSSSMGPEILKRLEQTSWVGCPAYLLDVIFFVHTQWYLDADPATAPQPTMVFTSTFLPANSTPLDSPSALLQHIQAFSPTTWAEEMQSCLYLPDLSARITLANIYKASVYLYASRVLSRPRTSSSSTTTVPPRFTLPPDHTQIATSLPAQLALIPPTDPHFKCLVWPTFIAGAECTRQTDRPFILAHLSTLYYAITSVNVRNAAWVLSLMWRKRDSRRVYGQSGDKDDGDGGDGGEDFDWIQELDDSRVDWLFI